MDPITAATEIARNYQRNLNRLCLAFIDRESERLRGKIEPTRHRSAATNDANPHE